ncbi:MAG: hypothetical protein CM15mP83_8140 [Flavobacteriaceae bacterium]|nr:MAG: hypothetical protein CM15mP83_8140 [Flavobacteriaceae bacterium]
MPRMEKPSLQELGLIMTNSTKGNFKIWVSMGIHDTAPNPPNKEFPPVGAGFPADEWTTLENIYRKGLQL